MKCEYDVPAGSKESVARALRSDNPFRPMWLSAISKERCRIEAYKTWRRLTQEEEQLWREGRLKAVPCALLLNKKRNSSYKARLVCLGDRWEPTGDNSANLYASVVSTAGNRVVLTMAAREGHAVLPFDIGNAFLRASIGDLKVCVTLPPAFRDEEDPTDTGRRILLKALYGLPVSPRLWQQTLHRDLVEKLQWVPCLHEPGVYRKLCKSTGKILAMLTVYVDDCVCTAVTDELAREEVEKVNKLHPWA